MGADKFSSVVKQLECEADHKYLSHTEVEDLQGATVSPP